MIASWSDVVPERRSAARMSRLMRGRVAMEIDDILQILWAYQIELLVIKSLIN
jgi:hypothetical protein